MDLEPQPTDAVLGGQDNRAAALDRQIVGTIDRIIGLMQVARDDYAAGNRFRAMRSFGFAYKQCGYVFRCWSEWKSPLKP